MITFIEIVEILITIFAVGFIFSGLIKKPENVYEYFGRSIFNLRNIEYSIIITAPAIILHELGHKFTAMLLGYTAVFHASFFGLALGVLLRLANTGFIFFIPGYVSIMGATTAIDSALIAFAGPLVNLILFLISYLLLKYDKLSKYTQILQFTKQINLWLFILNMLPIPGFDGFKTYTSLLSLI